MEQNDTTKWGTPVVYKNTQNNTFEIIPFGITDRKIASGFQAIDDVGAWVRARGGVLGTIKDHLFVGRYREIYLP